MDGMRKRFRLFSRVKDVAWVQDSNERNGELGGKIRAADAQSFSLCRIDVVPLSDEMMRTVRLLSW